MKLLGNRLLVEETKQEEKTPGGLFMPKDDKDTTIKGKVIAIGDCKDLTVDSEIIFTKYSGSQVKLNGKNYLMLREEDVLGVIQ